MMFKIEDPTHVKLFALADHIEAMPHTDIDNEDVEGHYFNMADYTQIYPCGTVCCIAGEVARLFPPENLHICEDAHAREVLGITDQEASWLFFGKFWPGFRRDIKPAQAAAEIRELATEYLEKAQ